MIDPQSHPMITPSEVMEYLYCPRFTYFLNVLKIAQYEEKRYKVLKGRTIHEQRLQQNRQYLRKKIPVVKREQNIYLADPDFGVRGIVDEIYFLDDGSVSPVDYKFTSYNQRAYRTHKIQLTLYALLIEKYYQVTVNSGYIVYIRGGNKTVKIDFTDRLKQEARKVVSEVFSIIRDEKTPKQTKYKTRCPDCTYKNICA